MEKKAKKSRVVGIYFSVVYWSSRCDDVSRRHGVFLISRERRKRETDAGGESLRRQGQGGEEDDVGKFHQSSLPSAYPAVANRAWETTEGDTLFTRII